ncbi:uncharacterized protein LOC119730243 [Patiria miniata]|uniref:Uncharacterized protein n=1 Tax=Patiria miniata TaxID=46514 RepID=A0A914A5H4_PATMI|nr:uncharacterized protein LOC119730243 [Patiria miniata]
MAASRLERDGDGLKLDPNFELLAILLALALQEEDAERFLEVYDHIVPKSLSGFEVEGIKDRARELSDLPRETLLELKAAQEESEAALSSSPGVGSLGRFASRRITDGLHLRTSETEQPDHLPHGKFQSKSGALLNQRLNAHAQTSRTSLDDQDSVSQRQDPVSHQEEARVYSRVDAESQTGASYVRQHRLPPASEQSLDQKAIPGADCTSDHSPAARDKNSNLDPNQWSTMASATAHNKVQKARTTSVKQHKKLSLPKNPATNAQDQQQVLMNGAAESVKSRTPQFTDKDKHCIKSKPPQTVSDIELCKAEQIAKIPNSVFQCGNSFCDSHCELGDYTEEERAALIPKSPPVPDSPPFKSLEDIGHSVGELLTNSEQPKNTTCPPPRFLSTTTARLAYPNSSDGSMAAKYGTVPVLDTCANSVVSDDDTHREEKTTRPKLDALANHQLPDYTPEDLTRVNTNSFSTPEVPSPVNTLATHVSPLKEEPCAPLDKDEFDSNLEEQPKSIESQWNAAKKKKKKNKKKKGAGSGFETTNINSVKLPVGAPPLPQSPPELRNKLQPKDWHTTSKLTTTSASENSRHPPMVSSDSVTSSGESSTDGGTCMNDVNSQQHAASARKDAVDSADNTSQTPQSNNNAVGDRGAGKTDLNSTKDVDIQESLSTELEPANTTPEADVHIKADIQPCNQFLSEGQAVQPSPGLTVKSDPSDSDSDKNDTKVHVELKATYERPVTAGKPHSLSEPTASADASADNDDNRDFIKVESKRSLRTAKKRTVGAMDDHRFVHPSARYMDRERDYFRNRNMPSAGLRKSSSEPTGMSELGDKDGEDIENKTKPKYLSDNPTKTDVNLTSSVPTETTTVPRSEFSYASKVKSNMKTSSLPPKLNPQVLLDYGDDEHSENPASSENSSDSVTGNKPAAMESKAVPSGTSVLDKNDASGSDKSELITAHSAKEQFMKNNIRPENHYSVSRAVKQPDDSSKVGQARSFQRSSSVDNSGATKKVSFDDNSIRRTTTPQGPEASVQYLDLTYAGRLKGQRPAISKAAVTNPQPPTSDAQKVHVAGLKDLKSQPQRLKPNDKEVLITSKASIVLSTKTPTQNDLSRGIAHVAKPASSHFDSSADFKPVDQPTNLQPRAAQVALPSTLERNVTSSPTPSVGSSTSKPHPVFDLEPQDNFDITFGSVIVRKVGYEILREESSAAKRGSPVKELLSKIPASGQLPTPPGLSCAELERSFMSQDSSQSTAVKMDDAAGGDSATTLGVSFGKFDGAWGIKAALEGKDDNMGDFNHLEVAGMLLAEWRKTQTEIRQNKVLVIE